MHTVVRLCFLFAVLSPASAATLHVCPDGSGEYPSLQAAVAAAASGDEIELCAGIFEGLNNVDIDVGSKSLTFRSTDGRDATTIDAGVWSDEWGEMTSHFCFTLGPGSETRIEGVTLINAFNVHSRQWGDGGAIRAEGAHLTLVGVRIQGVPYPHGAERGAGIFIMSGTLRAEDCEFLGNHARSRGGAIYSEGGWVELVRCYFARNAACSGGGSVHLDSGAISDCTFEHGGGGLCEGSQPGGMAIRCGGPGVTVVRSTFRNLHDIGPSCIAYAYAVEDCLFEDNDQESAASVWGASIVKNCTFRRNATFNWGAADIGLASGTIEGCVFLESHSSNLGGGPKGSIRVTGDCSVSQCTFARVRQGSAIVVESSVEAAISECVVAFATSEEPPVACFGVPASLVVTCTDLFDNAGGDWVGCVGGMEGAGGNFSSDPLFCDATSGNFALHSTSPCAPAQSGACGLIGALPVACGPTAVQGATWGSIKGMYR